MIHKPRRATSMLVTDVGEEMCWRQLWDVGDDFGRFYHQHPLSFNISVGHQHPKVVTNIENRSPTSTFDQYVYKALYPAFGLRLRPWSLQNVICPCLVQKVGLYHRLIKVLLGKISLPDISPGKSALFLRPGGLKNLIYENETRLVRLFYFND